MIKLLINQSSIANLHETSFGGLPVRDKNLPYSWPTCRECEGAMLYMGKIKTDIGLELIYMCQNDPGMCNDWDANGGGNQVIFIENLTDLEQFSPEQTENTLRNTEYSAVLKEVNAENYNDACQNWESAQREILGQLSNQPEWIQNDETPECNCCNQPMYFVAQLEEGPDHRTVMNFGGGGAAYLFDCIKGKTAKFLWQC